MNVNESFSSSASTRRIGVPPTDDLARNYERMILQMERELGSTVRRLELQRARQASEAESRMRELARVCEERKELRTALELSEQREKSLREELATRAQNWATERVDYERRIAEQENIAEAARESERRVLAQASAIESKIRESQAEYRNFDELVKLKTELEKRSTSQSEQIVQLQRKVAQLTVQLSEVNRSGEERDAETHYQQEENAALRRNIIELERRCLKITELERQVEMEKERLASAQDSLQSALRLNEARDKQIKTLQETLSDEKKRFTQQLESKTEEIGYLKESTEQLRKRCNDAESLRLEDVQKLQDELKIQREHTYQLSQQLAELESKCVDKLDETLTTEASRKSALIVDKYDDDAMDVRNPRQNENEDELESTLLRHVSQHTHEQQDHHTNNFSNRVFTRVLGNSQLSSSSSSSSSNGILQRFAIPDIYELVSESAYGDPNSSVVSEYINKVLMEDSQMSLMNSSQQAKHSGQERESTTPRTTTNRKRTTTKTKKTSPRSSLLSGHAIRIPSVATRNTVSSSAKIAKTGTTKPKVKKKKTGTTTTTTTKKKKVKTPTSTNSSLLGRPMTKPTSSSAMRWKV